MRIVAGVAEQPKRDSHLAHGAQDRVLHVHGHATGLRLRGGERGRDVVDGTGGDLGLVKGGEPCVGGSSRGTGPPGGAGGRRRLVHPTAVRGEARVATPSAARGPRTGAATGARCQRPRRSPRRRCGRSRTGRGSGGRCRGDRAPAPRRTRSGPGSPGWRGSIRAARRRCADQERFRHRRALGRQARQHSHRAEQPRDDVAIATPTFVGRPPSGSVAPVIDISPPTACTMKS